MENHKTIIIVAGLFFIFIFLSGCWVRKVGKPYHSFLLAIHKLISLVAGVVLGMALYRLYQGGGLSSIASSAVVVTGALFIFTVFSDRIWSIEKEIPIVVLRLHQVSLFLTALSTSVMLNLLI